VDRLDRLRSRRDRGAADTVREAERVEAALRNDAAGARGRDADRLRALADLLGRGTARLR
jgi:hypothetical protein